MPTASSRPLRILQIYPKQDFFTGAAIQLLGLATRLRACGHHVTIATRPSALWAERCAAAGLLHAAIPMRSSTELRSVLALARLIRGQQIEIVHCHKGRARTLTLLAGLLVRVPVLVLNRGVSFPLGLNRLGYVHPRVNAVVAVCRSIRDRLVASGVPAAKIEVIYNGTDLERFHPGIDGGAVRRELGLGHGQPLVTQIGIRPEKGNLDVLEAMVRVHQAVPSARLLLVGANEPNGAALVERARALGLDGAVHVTGKRDDIPNILGASDLVVDASFAGLGLTGVLREALACAVPVVATNLEGNPELVVHEETGLLVPPRDPAALGEAISRLLANPEQARSLARAGRARVEREFSAAVELERMQALYRRLLTRSVGA
jgi:glycosyltransferase involved in cell wall biosynthesis